MRERGKYLYLHFASQGPGPVREYLICSGSQPLNCRLSVCVDCVEVPGTCEGGGDGLLVRQWALQSPV